MKHLPNSNGLYKVNMKTRLSSKDKKKKILLIVVVIFVLGFIYQRISNFIAAETLKPRVNYVRLGEKRVDYRINGDGKYTLVFDGNIGANLNQWNQITDKLIEDYEDITTFVYNRNGYGYSDSGEKRTIAQQAEDLKILLRKAAANPPYILIGEEYGSLVLTEFAKAYPESVEGIVLVNPLIESEINTKEFKKSKFVELLRRRIETVGSNIGFTTLLQKLNLDCKEYEFEQKLEEEYIDEFNVQRTKKNYTKAVQNELINITSGKNNSQVAGVFNNKPYYLIAKDGQDALKNLGASDLTKVHSTTSTKKIVSMDDPEIVINGIRNVIKQANDIEKKNKKKKS